MTDEGFTACPTKHCGSRGAALYQPQLTVAGAPPGPLAGWAAEPKLDSYRNSSYPRQ